MYHSTLEVDDSRLPEPGKEQAGNLPEENYASAAPSTSTVCGLRKSTFWIVAIVVVILVVAAAVGGAVGGTQASKSTPKSTPLPTSTPGSSPNNSSPELVANSKLASLNYTDANGVDHYVVYFQILTTAIYQSAWNSSVQSWVVSPVTTKEKLADSTVDLDVKMQTPIAANIYWQSASVRYHKAIVPTLQRLTPLTANRLSHLFPGLAKLCARAHQRLC
jgi:hypothetical protein